VLQFILERHKPYAAIVLDRYANCMMGNGASERLVASLVDSCLLTGHVNHLRIVFHPLGARRFIVNWEEVGHHLLGRAEREFGQAKDDEEAAALLAELRGYAGPLVNHRPSARVSPCDLLLPIHIRTDDFELRIFSTIMTLGTPQDVTLQRTSGSRRSFRPTPNPRPSGCD
jgi:MmyB-like transcription regulator ligand binding domain